MSDFGLGARVAQLEADVNTLKKHCARVAELEAENERLRASCEGEKPDWLLSRLPGKTYKLEE